MEGDQTNKDVEMKDVSVKKEEEPEGNSEEIAEQLKAQGNEAFKQGDINKAIKFYSEALGNIKILFLLFNRLSKK